jgi:branched-chain amino acid transport system ATP-binding protein
MLKVEGVTKRFGGLVAVSSVNLEVERGEIVSLIGPNGAGKTTLFAMVGAYSHTKDTHLARQKAEEVAETVGMSALLDQGADGLTVAGRKRLELARALATNPKLLLLDEVMAGLNPTEIDEIVHVIKGIRDTGVTIFLIEHVMKAVMNLSDLTYVLNDGQLIASGTPKSVAADPMVIEAYLGHGAATTMAGQA